MLELNDQPSGGGESDLLSRCAFGLLFGKISKCPQCEGTVVFDAGAFRCSSYSDKWAKCIYKSDKHVLEEWFLPDWKLKGAKYLSKWKFKPREKITFEEKIIKAKEEDFNNEDNIKKVERDEINDIGKATDIPFDGLTISVTGTFDITQKN